MGPATRAARCKTWAPAPRTRVAGSRVGTTCLLNVTAPGPVHAGRAQGVGGLQRVPTLHAVPAGDTAPDLDVEPPHDGLDDRQVFLVLGRDASDLNRPTTARARRGKRRGIGLIHPRWNRSPPPASIGGACPPTLPPIAIAVRAGQLVTQARDLLLVALDQLVAFVARRSRARVGHACVMSYPRTLYKSNFLDLLPSPAKQRLI